jgi:hypothetical protein
VPEIVRVARFADETPDADVPFPGGARIACVDAPFPAMVDDSGNEEGYLAPPRYTPSARVPVQRVRGSVIASSLNAARMAGKEAEYFFALAEDAAAEIRALVTSAWLPAEIAMAHYRAMESLGFSPQEAHANGRYVVERIEGSYIATVVKGLGKAVGPLPILKRLPAARDRMLDGGDVAVWMEGARDARVEMFGTCLAKFDYVRNGWAGMFEGAIGLVTSRCLAKVIPTPNPEERTEIAVTWV